MSAGSFTNTKYQGDAGDIFRGRLQPETLALTINATANDAPAGAVDAPVSIKFTAANGEKGVIPRKIGVRFTSTIPDGYLAGQIYYLPILQKSVYDGISLFDTGSYLSNPVEVVVKLGEISR